MKNHIHAFRLSALSAAMLMAFGPAGAQEAEIKRLITPESTISLGVGQWSDDRPQLGIYDGMRDGKAYGLVDIDLVKRDDATGTWFILNGQNLGLDTRELKAEWLRQGDIGVSMEYSRLTRDNPLTFSTGLQGIGTTNQLISGAGGDALPMREVRLGTTRDLTQLGLFKNVLPNLDLKISFKNEKKEGTRHWGLGSDALFMVEPIDSTTRQLEATLAYAGERFQISGGYYGSWYNNEHSLVLGRVNGVADSAPGGNPASPTSLSLPLDNQAHQFFLNSGYAFTPTTRGTLKLSYGKATQDEQLPVAFNVIPLAGSPTSLNGRIDTTLVEAGLTSRPLPKLSLLANLRYHDVKDKTPVAQYVTGGYNTPHSFTKKSGRLEANYRLPEGMSLIGGVETSSQDRSVPTLGTLYVPFRISMDETTYRLQLRRSLSETINGSLAYLNSDRRGSGYTSTGNATRDAINPMHIADRKRDKWRLMLDWAPTDKLSLQFALDQARDSYGTSGRPFGLTDGSADIYTIDAAYTFNDNWQITAWYSRDDAKARDLSVYTALTETKDTRLREVGDTLGLGLRGQPNSKLKFGANLEWAKSVSQFSQALTDPITAGLTPLNDIQNKLTRLKLFAEYEMNKASSVRMDVIHERWRTDDWTWTFADGTPFVYGLTTDGTTVTASPRQNATFIGARYIYNFQ